ncbi:hypothetical protein B5F88_17725 [Flavonifractor sp. An306]|nr:hypothetical protein B5F88_17725 [Flavonifractor sp. An306]
MPAPAARGGAPPCRPPSALCSPTPAQLCRRAASAGRRPAQQARRNLFGQTGRAPASAPARTPARPPPGCHRCGVAPRPFQSPAGSAPPWPQLPGNAGAESAFPPRSAACPNTSCG